jgi:NAD(P)-dependent dehydrogenase (short-subunit alcohol dehydrogenase family)
MTSMQQSRVTVVTGAGSGIGRAIAAAFGAAGDRVVVADINHDAALQTVDSILATGGVAIAVHTDVGDSASVRLLAQLVEERFGPAHTLVNNAAIMVNENVLNTDDAAWQREVGVNLGGAFLCARSFLPQLLSVRGNIVNIASVNGFYAEAGCSVYCATKAAIIGLTKAMAIDHGRAGLRVNCICPGYIDTGLAASYFNAQADPQAARDAAGALHALGRVGTAEEVAHAALFLASPGASFITGSSLVVDGGFSAGLAAR